MFEPVYIMWVTTNKPSQYTTMKNIITILALTILALTIASCGDGKQYVKVTIITEQVVEVPDVQISPSGK